MRSHRLRRLALLAAAALIGAPVLWGSAAQAQPTDRVSFTGGCDSAQADAVPASAAVPAGATLEIVNELGAAAVLSLDGQPSVELPSGASTGVVLHRGPITAAMRVSCPNGDVTASVTIEVSDRAEPGSSGPRVGDPSGTASGGLIPRPDATDDPGDGSPSPGAGQETGNEGDVSGAPPAPTSGSGWSSGPEGLLAVVAALCVVAVSVATFWVLAVRRTVRTYHA